jgi:LCP family protein required for cell wall assembly
MNEQTNSPDSSAITQPSRTNRGLDSYQPVKIAPTEKPVKRRLGCVWIVLVFLILPILVYFFAPFRTNFLILGIDSGLGRGELGRTDTMILTTVSPLQPYVGMLSIPRDLWVPIEDVGANRINTAYFFAEAKEPGSGPRAALNTVSQNFHVPVGYYLVLRMDGLLDFIDAMGGVDITIAKPISGYAVGTYHLDGQKALEFARSRAGSDDFSRMSQGQLLIKAVMQRMLQPEVWPNLPKIIDATQSVVKMNIPLWQWPRLGLAILRSGQSNIDSRTITREMVRPFTTDQGAQVLEPNWEAIGKITQEMFGH